MDSNFGYNGVVPSNVCIQNNINEALAFQKTHSVYETLTWFKSQVQNKGVWDYKQLNHDYENFGNYNYAVVGSALGYSSELLKSAAGGAQIATNGGYFGWLDLGFTVEATLDYLKGLVSKNYGSFDNPEDQIQIDAGINAANNAKYINKISDLDILIAYMGNQLSTQPSTATVSLVSQKLSQLDYDFSSMLKTSLISQTLYNNYNTWSTDQLVNYSDSVTTNLNYNLGSNSDFGVSLTPIGAFYDVQNREVVDSSTSIAKETPVFLDLNNKAYTVDALKALDGTDNQLTGTELNAIKAWVDLNENGFAEAGEIQTLSALKITQVKAQDYKFYTQGNGYIAGAIEVAPTAPTQASNYQTIVKQTSYKETQNSVTLTLTITGDYIKPVTYNGQNYIVGTNSADDFDKNVIVDTIYEYVAGASKLKGLGSITNFLAGAGNDLMGGGTGNDNLWGGDGDDILLGYAGNDIVYGEEGNDELQGNEGNDKLVGGVGNDLAFGGVGQDSIWGGAGNDELQGNEGNDLLSGDVGNDVLFGQVGDDKLWGGDGDDVLVGFTGANELKQSLSSGETDNDSLYGGNGNDLIKGLLGNDILHGEAGNDELQGNEGDDYLYGGIGLDLLAGQVGNDVLYGGEGDDFLMGFTGANETKKDLSTGETDNNLIYGGGGQDTLIGGLGNDYLDGGAGADKMEGGTGNDVYIVNSVNDSILEKKDAGYDTVISSTNYQLNYGIEELRLIRDLEINATGNALNNRLIGNNKNNIIDGVTGKDTMIGGQGNDTYYIDDIEDKIEEYINEGTDTVQASISYTLGGNLENLVLLDFSKPEEGLVNNKEILVYGYPKRYELDYMQGDADPDYQGTCALTSIANVLVQSGKVVTEADVVYRATSNVTGETLAVTTGSASEKGGSTRDQQSKLLKSFGLDNDILSGYNEQAIANLIMGGRGVVIAVDSDVLWKDTPTATAGSVVDHVVTVTGVAFDKTTGALSGFFIADSGRKLVTDMNRYLDLDAFKAVANVTSAYSIYTIAPIKFWEENINGTGNELANSLVGNRGDNQLFGLAGNDTLQGLAGNDTLKGGLGADALTGGLGNDTLYAVDGTLTDTSVDTFIYNFTQNEGYDQIIGFNAKQDKIKVEKGINFATSVSSITVVNNDTLITLKNGTNINIVGVKTGIDSADFLFS